MPRGASVAHQKADAGRGYAGNGRAVEQIAQIGRAGTGKTTATDFFAGEMAALDERDATTRASKPYGRGRSGGSAADDRNIEFGGSCHHLMVQQLETPVSARSFPSHQKAKREYSLCAGPYESRIARHCEHFLRLKRGPHRTRAIHVEKP